ncbi:hypothetical protein WQ49_01240 [Burkholderia cenocepacia]|nr:hypothetical protein WQ49_01240 [Burkholderia cenocepacia]
MQRVRQTVGDIVVHAYLQVIAGRVAKARGRDMLALVAIPVRVARQQRATIDAVMLHRDPVGTNIALLENVYAQAEILNDCMYRSMDFAAIAKQEDIGKVVGFDDVTVPGRQAFRLVTIIPSRAPTGVGQVAATKIDAGHMVAAAAKNMRELAEKRGRRALQGKERTTHRSTMQ